MQGLRGTQQESSGIRSKKVNQTERTIEKRLYTLKEAAIYLGRSVDGLREVIWAKRLPIVRDGRKIWLDIRDLEAFVARNKSAAA